MKKLSLNEFKYLASLDPEFAAVIRKDGSSLILISDMEYSYDHRLRVECMSFELDVSLPFSESIVACGPNMPEG